MISRVKDSKCMKWLPLDLGSVAEIDAQATESVITLTALVDQHRTAVQQQAQKKVASAVPAQVYKAITVLRTAMASRIAALDTFYHDNDLDPRAAKLESTRLHMKKALRDLDVDAASGGNTTTTTTTTSAAAAAAHKTPSATYQPPLQQQVASPTPRGSGSNRIAAAGASASASSDMVSVRILMTPQEYEELRRRRDVMRTAHVRATEHVGGATMSANSYHQQQRQHNTPIGSAGGAGGRQATTMVPGSGMDGDYPQYQHHSNQHASSSLSWEHAAQEAQRRGPVSPPIVRASGKYVAGNDPRMQLDRSRGSTRVSVAGTNWRPSYDMTKPSPRSSGRYASPRDAATGGSRAVGPRSWSSAGVHPMSTNTVDKLRSFGAR